MKRRGKLMVFLGMAPGVGKTYAMLQAAQEQARQGVDVVIGYVETHHRAETDALMTPLKILPRQKISYQGNVYDEVDVDAILDRKPTLVLVDELAHSNIPGALHEKRWQDVIAILDAGIDVYTTINIQHIESRSDEVKALSGITVSETVPDLILEQADQVRLVDLSPSDLIQRLNEGKVYLSHKIEQATTHFFKLDTLAALRELVLRFVAEKVDSDLNRSAAFQTRKTIWNLNDRLMVAVSHSPYSKILIRTARRLAFTLGAPWIAVYVNQGIPLQNQERDQLSRNLELARNLGAEIVTTTDSDLIDALKRIASEKNVTKIVTGRSISKWWNRLIPSLSEQFVKELQFLDVYVVKTPKGMGKLRFPSVMRYWTNHFSGAWIAAFLLGSIVIGGHFLSPIIGYQTVGFFFLLGILMVGTIASLPVISGATLISLVLWDVIFIPPRGRFVIQQPEDIAMCLAFFGVASVMGFFSYRLKLREVLIRQKETQTSLLFQAAQCFSQGSDIPICMTQLNALIIPVLSVELQSILTLDVTKLIDDKERAVLEWAFTNKKTAGWSTDTLPSAQNWYIPLLNQDDLVGVLIVKPLHHQKFLPDEK